MDMEFNREPCPWRIIEDSGSAFTMGAVGGSVFHLFKGYAAAPRTKKWSSAITAVKTRAPIVGGSFAQWGILFASFDCAAVAIRGGKDDPWNAICAGFCTSALLSARGGPRHMAVQGVVGGVILALMEGVAIVTMKVFENASRPQLDQMPEAPSNLR